LIFSLKKNITLSAVRNSYGTKIEGGFEIFFLSSSILNLSVAIRIQDFLGMLYSDPDMLIMNTRIRNSAFEDLGMSFTPLKGQHPLPTSCANLLIFIFLDSIKVLFASAYLYKEN
jgi:hypothetical protein